MEPVVQPIDTARSPRRSDVAVEALLARIVDGELPAGALLPPERELADELDVNRTSLRQAVGRLEQMGVVASHQGRGTVVLDVTRATDPDVVGRLLARLGPSILHELFEVRTALGGLVGRLAAARATAADRDRIRLAQGRVLAAEGAGALQEAELELFADLVVATGNRPLQSLMRWLEAAYGRSGDVFTAAFADREVVVADLTAVVAAVGAGDEDQAEAGVRDYATRSAQRMLAQLRTDG